MTKTEYMRTLAHKLRRLPKEDYDKAMEYFEEYFAEAGSRFPRGCRKSTDYRPCGKKCAGTAQDCQKRAVRHLDRHSGDLCRTNSTSAGIRSAGRIYLLFNRDTGRNLLFVSGCSSSCSKRYHRCFRRWYPAFLHICRRPCNHRIRLIRAGRRSASCLWGCQFLPLVFRKDFKITGKYL